jgi:LacI family transcriptional regulator
MTGRRLGEILTARGISGVILAAFPMEPHEISLPWDDFAFVQVGHRLKLPRLDCVVSDHTEAMIMAARMVAGCGCRRVGLAIEKYQDEITDGRWIIGYAGLRATVPCLAEIPAFLLVQMNADLFLKWVNQHAVDCVLTLSTFRNEPNHMESWLATIGRSVPRDIGLISLDVTSVHADWSGVEQHSDEIGRAAVDLLFSKLQAGERGVPRLPRTLQVHGHWHDGRTLLRPVQIQADTSKV